MNYFIQTFGIWKNNISPKFHKIFIKKYCKLTNSELVFRDVLEKSILAVTRITREIRNIRNIRNEKIWTKDKKKIEFEFLAELYAKQ